MHITELDSFQLSDAVKFHNRLNPKIWGRDEHLLPEVREKLTAIAENFREFLGVGDLDVKDITISGSNAAYNYTPYSDIDLHLVVEFPADNEVYQELFNAKKYQYNDEHKLSIGGVPVELYVQNAAESPVSQGEYSISRGEWIQVPRRKRARIDDTCVRAKVEDIDARIHSAIQSGNAESMGRLWDKIKAMRQSGLEQEGEFGCENIVFKVLRNKGCIKELRAARTAAQDRELSLREQDHAPQFHWGFAEGHQGQPYSSPDGVAPSTEMFLNEDDTESMVEQFIQDTAARLGIEHMPEIVLHDDDGWSEQNHSFGMYQPELHVLHVNLRNRHVMDILRTVAHELAHCRQHEIEQLDADAGATGSPVENEANAVAGIIMRDFAEAHPELFGHEAITEAADLITQNTVENAKRFKALQNTGLKLLPFGKAPNGNAVYIYDNSARPTVVVDMGGFTVPFYNSSGLGGKETVAAGNWYPFFGLGPITGWINKGSEKDINEFYDSEKLKKVANILNATLGRPLRDKTHMMGWSAFPGDDSQFVAVVNKGLSPVDYVEPFDTNGWIKNINSLLLKVGGKQYKAKATTPATAPAATAPVAKPAAPAPTGSSQRDKDYYDALRAGGITDKELFGHETVAESSGYIPTWAERNDPRFEMALSVDVHPGQTGTEANKMRLETDAQGHPQLLRADGKVSLSESLAREFELFEEQDLFEINMGSKNLRREAAKTGAIAGMEFEMIVPGMESEDPEQEPDYDQDQRCRSIDDAVQFFHDGDYNHRRDVERLRERMQNDFLEWRDDKLRDDWGSESEDYLRDWLRNNVNDDEWNPDELTGDERNEVFDEFAANIDADPSSDYYNQAFDEWREEFQDNYDESDWLDAEDLDVMSGIENAYEIMWPHWTSMNSGEIDADQVADEFSRAVGREVRVNTRYHQSGDRPGPNNQFYIVEPDASLDGDNAGDEGLEFVSPPMPIDELLKDLNAVKAWAGRMGVYTNSSTGLHINISVPNYSVDRLDYVKLALLLGDEYVLNQFGRSSNTYTKSALGKVRDRVRSNPEDAQQLLDKMKGQMGDLASKAIHSGSTDKYTSINTKDGHIEFRSPGGDWLDDNFDKIENTLLRFTVAMSAALNPEAYREEYQKKLYKLLTQDQKGSDTIRYFADYVAGKIPKAALRSFVKQAQLQRKTERDKTSGEKMWWNVSNPGNSYASVEVVATSREEAIEKALGDDGYPSWANTRQSIVAEPVRPYNLDAQSTQDDDTASAFTAPPGSQGGGRPNDPNGRYAIVLRSDPGLYGSFTGPAPDYQFRFNMGNPAEQAQGRYVLQAWAARNNVVAADYMVVDTEQWNRSADAASGGIIDIEPDVAQALPGSTAALAQQRATPGTFSGAWKVMVNGEEVHRFSGVGNNQSDANRVAATWLRNNGMGVSGEGFEVYPIMTEGLSESASDYELHDRPKLDRVLAKCCRMVVQGQQRDPERYGQVAACVIDPDNRMIYGINLPAKDGTRRHAERVAIDKYRKSIGEIPQGSIVVTTCSPCNSPMEERHGESCKDLLNSVGIHKVYAGYQDPTQHDDRDADFRVYVTENDQLWGECQLFAQTFLGKEELAENFQEPVNEILKITPFQMSRSSIDTHDQGIKSAKKLPGGSGLLYKIDNENFRVTISIYDPQKQGKNPVGRQIGILTLSPGGWYLPIESSLRVNMIAVDPQYRAQGIAKAMYGLVLTKMKRTLVAGDSQSPGGRKNWLSLAQIPGVSVKGYVAIDNRLLDSRIDTIMGKLGGEYIGSDLSNRKFFAFDVLPGTNELKPAVVTSLNKIYSGALPTGLYATWSGTVNEQGVAEENELDEDWKSALATGAMAGAMAMGAGAKVPEIVRQAVEPGDTVYSIARQNNVNPVEIFKLNKMDRNTKLEIGQKVLVPDYSKPAAATPTANPLPAKVAQPATPKVSPTQDSEVTLLSMNSDAEAALQTAAKAAGLRGVELAQFMAQTRHESWDFSKMKEVGSKQRFAKYEKPKLAKQLGNKVKGDGELFKGRGFIQLTGRDNYTRASKQIFGDDRLIKNPDLASRLDVGAQIALWFWKNQVRPNVKNFNNTTEVVKAINAAEPTHVVQQRHNKFKEYLAVL